MAGAGALPAWAHGAQSQPSDALWLSPLLPPGTLAYAALETLPGKRPLIRLTSEPPNYESPLGYFRTAITPNDEFFVRYHLADIPEIEASSWKLDVGGEGANGAAQIGLDELKKLPAFEIIAVCQCSGNRRGLVQPHVAGVQWGYGGMGCARWKGARLKDVLDLAGLKKDALEVVFDAADGPLIVETPDFAKSLPLSKAVEETTLIAYEMNGEPLPHWNGFPARIVVPGWTATYWVKHLTKLTVVTRPFEGYWMKTAYRIPLGKFPLVARFKSQATETNTPITEMVVNSLITTPFDGTHLKVGLATSVSGIAWDGGYGISEVDVSLDGGKSWTDARLGEDLGRFAFRSWSYEFTPLRRGKFVVMARATNKIGQTQTKELIQNPGGYHHNVLQSVTLDVV